MDFEYFMETYGFTPDDLDKFFEEKKYRQLKQMLNDLNDVDMAEYLEQLESEDHERALLYFRMLSKDNAADVFSHLPVETQENIINGQVNTRTAKGKGVC